MDYAYEGQVIHKEIYQEQTKIVVYSIRITLGMNKSEKN